MRLLLQSPPTLLSLLAIVLSSTHTAIAKPLRRVDGARIFLQSRDSLLEERDCPVPCGWDKSLCCAAGQTCFTNSYNQAQCGVSSGGSVNAGGVTPQNYNAGGSYWQYYTTTYVETDLVTRTSVYSSYMGAATYAPSPTIQVLVPVITPSLQCSQERYEIPCGNICCAVGQYCQYQGQCMAVNGPGADPSSFYFSSVMNAQTGSAFIRPTSVGFYTITSTGAPTKTVAFEAPMATGAAVGMAAASSGGGLSGGAIAGIVIGVLLGIFLLFLFCAFFCFKGVWDLLSRLFGGGPRRKQTTETYIASHHSSHGGAGGRRNWFGRITPNKPPPKKSGGLGGILGVAGILAALAAVLGLKRSRRDKSSYGTGSSYSYSDYTSSSGYPAVS